MSTHELKCWPEYFRPLVKGVKNFEVRQGNDRRYAPGDWLHLREYHPQHGYTGVYIYKQVEYVLHGGPFLPDDVWVLGLVV